MNDFDDRLSRALRDEDVDRTVHPDLDSTRRGWRRRRQRRLAGTAGALSVLAIGAGFGVASLAQNDPAERVATDTVSTTVPVPTTDGTATPTTLAVLPGPTTVDTARPVEPAPPTTEQPAATTVPPDSTAPTTSTPAPESRGLDVADGYVARTTVFDIDNRLEIRSMTNEVLWAYQYCEPDQRCNASVQTVLADGFWVVVGDNPNENGLPESSTLRRVGVDGETVEVRAETQPGTYLVAAQPTVLGELVAVAEPDPTAWRLISVSVTLANGEVRELATGVSDVEVSADGRYLATTWARPSQDSGRVYLTVFDLQTGETNDVTLVGVVTAAPIEFSGDGSRLLIRNTWELQSDFVLDPWTSGPEFMVSDATIAGSEICLVDATTAAVAAWNSGYGEEGATTGTVRLVDIENGDVTADLGFDTFGRQLVCGPDGSVTFVRVPLVANVFGSEDDPFIIVEQDFDASVDVVRVESTGAQTVLESGDVSIRNIR